MDKRYSFTLLEFASHELFCYRSKNDNNNLVSCKYYCLRELEVALFCDIDVFAKNNLHEKGTAAAPSHMYLLDW